METTHYSMTGREVYPDELYDIGKPGLPPNTLESIRVFLF